MKEAFKFGKFLTVGISTIAAIEGKRIAAIDFELSEIINRKPATIQHYKGGNVPPDKEIIKVLAKEIIQRAKGNLSREWAQALLDASGRCFTEDFLEKFFSSNEQKIKKEKIIYHNPQSRVYGQFIMREKAYSDMTDLIFQDYSSVVIFSMGGMGKTTLIQEIIKQELNKDISEITFDAIVWIDAKEQIKGTDLVSVLDEICITLEYPGHTSLAYKEKLQTVNNILNEIKILLIIDGAETIRDHSILKWLLNLPGSSRCLLTTREKSDVYSESNSKVYELDGMKNLEVQEFVQSRLTDLNMKYGKDTKKQIKPLLKITGGNPKAIEIILGYMSKQHQTLSETIKELTSSSEGELFDYLFSKCWAVLSSDAKQILMIMHLFPQSGSKEAVMAVSSLDKYRFNNAITTLKNLSLVNVIRSDLESPPRYILHPLVDAFSELKSSKHKVLEADAREKWVNWYCDFSSRVGFCWNDIEKLELLEQQGERRTIQTVMDWAYKNDMHDKVIKIGKNARYYFYVKGYWALEPSINVLRAKSAVAIGNLEEELDALLYHCNIASKQGNLKEVNKYWSRVEEIVEIEKPPEKTMVDYRHVKALYFLAQSSYERARLLWDENLKMEMVSHAYNANRRWYAVCLYHEGELPKAKKLLCEVLKDAQQSNFVKGEIATQIRLAWIDIDEENFDLAKDRLESVYMKAHKIDDQRAIADYFHCIGTIHVKSNNNRDALEFFMSAKNQYERLGMNPDAAQVEHKIEALVV